MRKEEVKKLIKEHYLPAFFYVALTVSVAMLPLFFNERENKIDTLSIIIVILSLIFVLTFILGFLKHKFLDKYNLKKQKKIIKKKLFEDFKANGFLDNEVCISGYIKDYFIVIYPEIGVFTPEKWLIVKILFNPKQKGQFIPQRIFDKLNGDKKLRKKNYTWLLNGVHIKKQFGLKLPDYDKFKILILEAIDILKENNIEPITEENWEARVDETINHHKHISRLVK